MNTHLPRFTPHALQRLAERAPGLAESEAAAAVVNCGVEIDLTTGMQKSARPAKRFIVFWDNLNQQPLLAVSNWVSGAVLTILSAEPGVIVHDEAVDNEDAAIIVQRVSRKHVRDACMKAGVAPPERYISSPAPVDAKTLEAQKQRRPDGAHEFVALIVKRDGKQAIKHIQTIASPEYGETDLEKAKADALARAGDALGVLLLFRRRSDAKNILSEWVLKEAPISGW